MKILWFTNIEINNDSCGSGSWISSMADLLAKKNTIQLNIITQGNVKTIIRKDYQSIKQWLIPSKLRKYNGLPRLKTIREIQKIIDEIKPDIIHIWGTENYWGLLLARGYIRGKVIVEIQGLKFEIAKYFLFGLSLLEIFQCFGLKEFLKPSVSLIGLKFSFIRWGRYEKEILIKSPFISTQSDWVRTFVKELNPKAKIFNTTISLRPEFLKGLKWDINNCIPFQILTLSASDISYKGLHVLIKAIIILRKKYPHIKLHIIGYTRTGLKESGYSKYLKRIIRKSGIIENIIWLGSLNAKNIVQQMLRANVVVVPSFIESYCLALDEALTIGVPCAASFAGAMPELAIHNKTALFFTPGDSIMCANSIETLCTNKSLANNISQNAYAEKNSNRDLNVTDLQLSIYTKLLTDY
jgi:glycosyltransferase involved in cell wall biosynthesis